MATLATTPAVLSLPHSSSQGRISRAHYRNAHHLVAKSRPAERCHGGSTRDFGLGCPSWNQTYIPAREGVLTLGSERAANPCRDHGHRGAASHLELRVDDAGQKFGWQLYVCDPEAGDERADAREDHELANSDHAISESARHEVVNT
ncbi:hypothetical protein BP6252_11943 [Coleophoma cylindrospora]|uniref:Uncharacterized protein n=1 Tax=Coleophoma cylindrospora TaxID=1849047 RepID=A0A3D8QFW0_9HELO|nr:hypothetical protein BP6252_11943 [Coleophoma cylindrospora]